MQRVVQRPCQGALCRRCGLQPSTSAPARWSLVEHASHDEREVGERERLLQEVHPPEREAVTQITSSVYPDMNTTRSPARRRASSSPS